MLTIRARGAWCIDRTTLASRAIVAAPTRRPRLATSVRRGFVAGGDGAGIYAVANTRGLVAYHAQTRIDVGDDRGKKDDGFAGAARTSPRNSTSMRSFAARSTARCSSESKALPSSCPTVIRACCSFAFASSPTPPGDIPRTERRFCRKRRAARRAGVGHDPRRLRARPPSRHSFDVEGVARGGGIVDGASRPHPSMAGRVRFARTSARRVTRCTTLGSVKRIAPRTRLHRRRRDALRSVGGTKRGLRAASSTPSF